MTLRHQPLIHILKLSLAVAVLLLVVKFSAWWLTGSNAIFTDALESIVNVIAAGFALYSMVLSAKPRDKNHPYGHGKIEFVSAGTEGVLIVIAAISIVIKSIYGFIHPQAIEQLDSGMMLIAFTGVINFGMGYWLSRRGRHSGSLTLIASGRHLKSDAYSTAALMVGLLAIYFTEAVWLDNAIALAFAGFIGYTGFVVLKQSIGGIMDEADYSMMEDIIATLSSHREPDWIDIHNMRLIRFGRDLHIDCHLTLPYYYDLEEAHKELDRIEQLINMENRDPVELFIHTDPCLPPGQCRVCMKSDCPVRQQPFEERITWRLENVMENKKHI